MRRPRRREPTRPLGTARSDGCIRVENAAICFLATHVPDGSAVDII
jgi:lipoprotein-anchoring transpeptidase ErfK/SrfK